MANASLAPLLASTSLSEKSTTIPHAKRPNIQNFKNSTNGCCHRQNHTLNGALELLPKLLGTATGHLQPVIADRFGVSPEQVYVQLGNPQVIMTECVDIIGADVLVRTDCGLLVVN